MPAVEHVAKLFTLSAEHGEVSAFDSYGCDVFVGTTLGYLLHLSVDGLETVSRHRAPSSVDLLSQNQASEAFSVFSTLVASAQATTHGAVHQLQHSRAQPLLVVRCGEVLSVWRADTLELVSRVGADTSLCFLAPAPGREAAPARTAALGGRTPPVTDADPLGGGGLHTRTVSAHSTVTADAAVHLNDRGVSADGTPLRASPAPASASPISSADEARSRRSLTSSHCGRVARSDGSTAIFHDAPERVFVVPRSNPKLINVLELSNPVVDGGDVAHTTRQTFVLPEPVISVFGDLDMLCVRTRRQCSVLALRSGASRQVARFRRDDDGPRPALTICADTSELCLAHHRTVLRGVEVAPLAPVPSSNTASSPNSAGHREGALVACYEATETVHLLVTRHPYLLVFTAHACDVLSLVAPASTDPRADTVVVERLALAGILFSSPLARGDNVFVASRNEVWLLSLYPLRYQLAQLVSQGSIDEAFRVLQRRRRRIPSSRLESIELELHILAGFVYLRQARPHDAFAHLAHRVDPREVLRHIPECVPSRQHSAEAERVCRAVRYRQAGDADAASPETYWRGWEETCPYNTPAGQLQTEWLQFFEACPAAPNALVTNTVSLQTSSGSLVRVVPLAGPMTAAVFLESAWEQLKDATVLYLRARLRDEGDALTAAQRRSIAYSLLILMLERQDHRGAYHVVANDKHLALEDVYDLLTALSEFRLLALLLFQRGLARHARDLLRTHVYTSRLLRPPCATPLPTWDDAVSPAQYASACWEASQANAGVALRSLPSVVRWRMAKQLYCGDLDGVCGEGTTDAARWAATVDWYRAALMNMVTTNGRRLQPPCTDGPITFPVLDDSGATPCELPGSLREVFYLVDHMNLPALLQVLEARPALVTMRDEEGATLLHAVFSQLVFAFSAGASDTEAVRKDVAAPSPAVNATRTREIQSAVLDIVLAAMSVVVDCGCPINAVSLHAQTALDVVWCASHESGTACVDVVASALAAMSDVNRAANAVQPNDL